MTKRRLIIALLLLVAAATAIWFKSQTPKLPKIPPSVEFATITGERITLKQLRGKVVIVTFWATDCASCLKEIPHLIDLYTRYHTRGLEIIAVAMSYNPPNHVLDMAHAKQLPYPIALDLYGDNSHAFGDVSLTPSTFLIAPDGSLVWQTVGQFSLNDMKTRLVTLL
jgi:thiol-disulfide isomerase/thioredoxin